MDPQIQTLAMLLAFTSVLLLLVLLVDRGIVSGQDGLTCWIFSNAFMALGFLFNLARIIPALKSLSVIANSLCFYTALMLLHIGIRKFFAKPPHVRIHLLWVAVGTTYAAVFSLFAPSDDIRRFGFSVNHLLIDAAIALTLFQAMRKSDLRAIRLLVFTEMLQAAFWLFRAIALLPGFSSERLTASLLTPAGYVVQLAAGIMTTFGLVLLVNGRLAKEGRQEHLLMERIFNTSPDAVLISRLSDGKCVHVNHVFLRLSGFSEEELLGHTTVELGVWTNPDDRAKVVADLRDRGSCEDLETVYRRKDGTLFHGLFCGRIVEMSGEPHMVSFTRDITERKLVEEQIRELVRQLELEKGDAMKDARTDSLTGIQNRRSFDDALHDEYQRFTRGKAPLSLILLDVDYFKNFNDAYGHVVGDECLQRIAGAMRHFARRTQDRVARYGGEEFAVILPETDAEGAGTVAESLRLGIEALSIPHSRSCIADHVTVSLGVATALPEDNVHETDLVTLADQALYRAKELGRNRVECVPDGEMKKAGEQRCGIGPVRLVWNESCDCGEPTINAQHRILYEQANELLTAILDDRPQSDCVRLIEGLIEGIGRHFADEEVILERRGYAELETHAALHRRLVAQSLNVLDRMRSGEKAAGEVFEFLAHDVVAIHMLKEDRKFVSLFDGRAAGG